MNTRNPASPKSAQTGKEKTSFLASSSERTESQDVTDFQRGTTNRPGDDFWQFNALVGYRFARNRWEISAGVLNLTDTDYQLAPITYHDTLPRERTAVIRCNVTF